MNILEKVKALQLPERQYVVMGSAILELKGIREAEDLDIIVTKQVFERLKKNSKWKYMKEKGSLGDAEVESLENDKKASLYWNIYGGGDINFFLSDPSRVEEIDGVLFVSLSNLLEVKSNSWNREKDKKDVELIRVYLAQNK